MFLSNLFHSAPAQETPMASTINGTATFDKTSYAAGDTMTLTVVRSGSTSQTLSATAAIVLAAPDGTTESISAGPVDVTRTVSVAVSASVSDDGSRSWTLQSDDGATAVYTATA
jgi:hypothetical protein